MAVLLIVVTLIASTTTANSVLPINHTDDDTGSPAFAEPSSNPSSDHANITVNKSIPVERGTATDPGSVSIRFNRTS